MKTYHGIRISQELGDVKISIRQQWGTCTKCQDLIPAGPDHQFEHFNASFTMCNALIVDKTIQETPLIKRNKLEPDDFEWGPRHQAGAYNLSLSILWDVTGEQPTRHLAKSFALRTIMALPRDEWYLSEQDVQEWLYSTSPRHAMAG